MGILSGSTKIAFGFGLGLAAAGVVKEILPAFRGLGRPLLKATVKSAIILGRNSEGKLAEFRETLADVAAEAQAELAAEPRPARSGQPMNAAREQSAGVM